jgi:hypothetical protein
VSFSRIHSHLPAILNIALAWQPAQHKTSSPPHLTSSHPHRKPSSDISAHHICTFYSHIVIHYHILPPHHITSINMSDNETGITAAAGAGAAFTERELQMLGWAMQSLKTGPPEVRIAPSLLLLDTAC